MYEIYEANGYKFYFKFDYDSISKEYVPHVWIRHLLEPEQVIEAFFNISEKSYNKIRDRWEGYSKQDGITIYYFFKKIKNNEVLIITAFKE